MIKKLKFKLPPKFLQILKEQKLPILLTLLFLFLLALFFRVFILGGIRKVINLRRELVVTNEKLYELQSILNKHPNIEEEIKLWQARNQKLNEDFPSEKEFLNIGQRILRQLEEQGIKLINFKYLYELKNPILGDFKKYGLELELLSDYLKFGKFLEDLENQGVKFLIDDIQILRLAEGPLNIKVKLDFILKREGR